MVDVSQCVSWWVFNGEPADPSYRFGLFAAREPGAATRFQTHKPANSESPAGLELRPNAGFFVCYSFKPVVSRGELRRFRAGDPPLRQQGELTPVTRIAMFQPANCREPGCDPACESKVSEII